MSPLFAHCQNYNSRIIVIKTGGNECLLMVTSEFCKFYTVPAWPLLMRLSSVQFI